MGDHPTEPHTHTLTFRDNAGKAYSFDHECPTNGEAVRDGLLATGAESINDLAADGRVLPFETVLPMLGSIGLLPWLGESYQTPENLIKLLVAMGTGDEAEAEPEGQEVTA